MPAERRWLRRRRRLLPQTQAWCSSSWQQCRFPQRLHGGFSAIASRHPPPSCVRRVETACRVGRAMCSGVSAHTLLGWEAPGPADAEQALDSREPLLDNGVASGDALVAGTPRGSACENAQLGSREPAKFSMQGRPRGFQNTAAGKKELLPRALCSFSPPGCGPLIFDVIKTRYTLRRARLSILKREGLGYYSVDLVCVI
ncbi:hypothetical protein ON010_g11512 [Phytophthora cinnamomi]|nr:hypothetical protein ON010_g11512 [Phytophthora cinnamomi]